MSEKRRDIGSCGNCWRGKAIAEAAESMEAVKSLMYLAQDNNEILPTVAAMATDVWAQYPQLRPPQFDECETTDDILETIKINVGNALDDGELFTHLADEWFDACNGPLRMRARSNGRIVTAAVCNNPLLADGLLQEVTPVNRQPE